MTPAIALNGVGLRFGRGAERLADVALAVPSGGIATLCGPAGSGKTLLLEIVALARRPSRGSVRLFGQESVGSAARGLGRLRQRLGWIEAEPAWIGGLDPIRSAALPLLLGGLAEADALARAAEMLSWLGVASPAKAAPSPLLARQVAWSRAALGGAELVLVDEWCATPEPLRRQAQSLMAQLARQGVAFLLTGRDAAALASVPATDRWRIADGRVSPDGSVAR